MENWRNFMSDRTLGDAHDYIRRADKSWFDDEYLRASTEAQIAIAMSLRDLVRITTTLTEDLKKAVGDAPQPLSVSAEQLARVGKGETVELAPAPGKGKRLVVSVEDADPFAGVCNRCGWEFKHMAHDEKYGSHKFEPSPYKSLAEWREGNNAPQVLKDVE